jgi:hypothetical protein
MREGVVVQRSCLMQPLCLFDLRQTSKLASFGFFAKKGSAYVHAFFVNAGDTVPASPKHSGVSGFIFRHGWSKQQWDGFRAHWPRLLPRHSPEQTAGFAASYP